jgi:hypothetical protein
MLRAIFNYVTPKGIETCSSKDGVKNDFSNDDLNEDADDNVPVNMGLEGGNDGIGGCDDNIVVDSTTGNTAVCELSPDVVPLVILNDGEGRIAKKQKVVRGKGSRTTSAQYRVPRGEPPLTFEAPPDPFPPVAVPAVPILALESASTDDIKFNSLRVFLRVPGPAGATGNSSCVNIGDIDCDKFAVDYRAEKEKGLMNRLGRSEFLVDEYGVPYQADSFLAAVVRR